MRSLNFDPIDITLVQICKQYRVQLGGIKLDSMLKRWVRALTHSTTQMFFFFLHALL